MHRKIAENLNLEEYKRQLIESRSPAPKPPPRVHGGSIPMKGAVMATDPPYDGTNTSTETSSPPQIQRPCSASPTLAKERGRCSIGG